MTITVSHATQATQPNDPSKEVSKDAWNADHTVTGLGTAAESAIGDFDAAGTATAAVAAHAAAVDPHPTYLTAAEGAAAYQPLDTDLTVLAGLVDPNADRILFWDDSAGAYAYLTASTGLSISGTNLTATGGSTWNAVCNGRLTLETAVPASTTDQTAKTTVYFTPHLGNQIGTYSGSAWTVSTFTEKSLALGTLTSDKNYDVFIVDSTLALEFSAAWTTDTARADAIVLQDGVYVKSGTTTRRWLGTIRTTATTTTEDSEAKRFVWNLYNREWRTLQKIESTASWTYASATLRQARASAANQLEVVCGLAGSCEIQVDLFTAITTDTASAAVVGIGEDSTTAFDSYSRMGYATISTAGFTNTLSVAAALHKQVPLGYHKYTWLEGNQSGAGTTTYYGTAGDATHFQAGIQGMVQA